MHGGIGMTAEYSVGHYVSRLTAIEHTLGSVDDHIRVLAADVAGHDMGTSPTEDMQADETNG